MQGIAPDFGYDERKLRVFEAGNFFERVVAFVLVAAGILIYDNKRYEIPEDDEHLMVSVKPDFVAGGKPNWEKAKEQIDEDLLLKLMPNLGRIAKSLVEMFAKNYPEGLNPLVYEIKSINSQVFWSKKDYLSNAYPHHLLQLYAEMKATGLSEGRILYISKDDLTTSEFAVKADNPKLIEAYENDVKLLTKYIRSGEEPPKPESIVFDPRAKLRFQSNKNKCVIEGCWVENWQIGWSNYITKITGIKGKDQKEVAEKWSKTLTKEIGEKNKVLKDEYKQKALACETNEAPEEENEEE